MGLVEFQKCFSFEPPLFAANHFEGVKEEMAFCLVYCTWTGRVILGSQIRPRKRVS